MPQMESSILNLTMYDPQSKTTSQYTFDPLTLAIYDESGERCSTDHLLPLLENAKVHDCKCNDPSTVWHKDNHPSHIRISIGQACNFRCKYCVQEHDDDLHEEITEETIKQFAQYMKEYIDPKHLKMIQFWGGEPFLYGDRVFLLMKYLYPIFKDKVMYFTLTNGSLLTREIIDKCIKHHLCIGLSHDGPGQMYRSSDPLQQGTASRDALMYYWDLIKKGEIKEEFSIVATTTDKFIEDINATEKYFTDIFGEEIILRVNAFPLIINDPLQMSCSIDTSSSAKIPLKIFKYLYDKQLTPSLFLHLVGDWLRLFMKKDFTVNKDQVTCFIASSNALTFDLFGNIFPCQNFCMKNKDGIYEHKIGHITDIESVSMPPYKRLKDKETKCLNCPVVSFCMGGCPLSSYKLKDGNCTSTFTYYMGLLSFILYLITGKLMIKIDGDFPCKDL